MPISGRHHRRRLTYLAAHPGKPEDAGPRREPYDALTMALRLQSFPTLANQIRRAELPVGMIVVIRIAGGCGETRAAAVELTGLSEALIAEAAMLFLSLLLSGPTTDPYRILCARPHTPMVVLRDHMVWLLKWLHPDRHGSERNAPLAGRVIEAWHTLKSASANELEADPALESGSEISPRARRSNWRAVPISLRRAQLEEAAKLERLRRSVEDELSFLRAIQKPPVDET